MRWPLDRIFITQRFGDTSNPAYGPLGHPGIDLRTRFVDSPLGNREVFAPAAGVVIPTSFDAKGYGNYILIEHDDGVRSLCGHLNSKIVSSQVRVEKGARIGISGSTGWSSGEHVHFEVREKTGKPVNPLPYVDPSEIDKMPVDTRYGKPLNLAAEVYVRSFETPKFVKLVRPLRLPTQREINALAYGSWGVYDVLDPAMWELWSVRPKA